MDMVRLEQTRAAFDSVAADYDGPRGNNELIQEMRAELWRWLDARVPARSRLIDLGCGTGLDAVRMAGLGHHVTATDWSPRMIERTAARAAEAGLAERLSTAVIGAQELERLPGAGSYDAAYSDLGPLNCVPSLRAVSRECARLLTPDGQLIFSVIGRVCPWEIAHYAKRRRFARIAVRFARNTVPVGMNQHTIWTRYYTPREFYAEFAAEFSLEEVRGLCTFAPPPYITWLRERHPAWHARLWRWDRATSGWPLLRSMGDHFIIVLRRRAAA
jgi:SAM-dependent methyltransferase